MSQNNKLIDGYIAKAAPFAQPVLKHFRLLVHKVCPDVEEKIKWGFPHFDYKGSMMCSMAAFKQHCAFGFWKASIMKDSDKILSVKERDAMGHLGQIKSLADLPSDKILLDYIKQAAKMNEEGIKLPSRVKTITKTELEVPDYMKSALKKNKKAFTTFEAFSPGNKKEYITWVTEAKTEETRNKRLETAIEWMAEGKIRNWKYVKK